MNQKEPSIRQAISNYFINRNKYNSDFNFQESNYPSFEQIRDSPELQEVLSDLLESQREGTLKSVVENLIKEEILDNKRFPGGVYHIIVGDLHARNFETAAYMNDI